MVSVQPYLPRTNSSFPLRLSELQGMFNLGQICQNSEANIWKPAYRYQTVLSSLINARCFSQSEPALYGNFIIKWNNTGRNSLFPHFLNATDTENFMFPLHLRFAET